MTPKDISYSLTLICMLHRLHLFENEVIDFKKMLLFKLNASCDTMTFITRWTPTFIHFNTSGLNITVPAHISVQSAINREVRKTDRHHNDKSWLTSCSYV